MVRVQTKIKPSAERGQAIVEFALILPIMIIMMLAIVYFAMAFNLQMVLNTAAREGARAWASARMGTNPCCENCISPCDPELDNSEFVHNVTPIIKKIITDNGYSTNNLIISPIDLQYTEDGSETLADLNATQWQNLSPDRSAMDASKVKLLLTLDFELPSPSFEIMTIRLRSCYTFKRGS